MVDTYLKGQVAVVTGGAKGLGKAISLALAARGASVVLVDVDSREGEKVSSAIAKDQGHALFIHCDVKEEKEIVAMVDKVIKEFGRIDILVNNAGIGTVGLTWELPTEAWDNMNAVNLRGTFLCCKHIVPQMIRQKSGRIINISSNVGRQAQPFMSGYATTKAGQISLTVALAKELADHGINVNAVCPGPVETPFWDNIKKTFSKVLSLPESEVVNWFTQNKQSIKVPLKPEDIASAVSWLTSPETKMITGQALSVCGGEIVPTF
jgi:meso-butanediol dehydrogenase/(S,S)-butanediol dehydrogenase/diacetyl reductase